VRANRGDASVFTVQIERILGDYARVRLRPVDPLLAEPALVFLQRQASGWTIVAGPGAAFMPEDLEQAGVPASIRLGNRLEETLERTARGYALSNAGYMEVAWALDRIEDGYAHGQIVPLAGAGDRAYLYAREEQGDWLVLAIAPVVEPGFYAEYGIPRTLWLGTPSP
jgi:hypothetical protein